jgi:hypothetical protein
VPGNPRWDVAEQVAAAVLRRYPDEVHAIGVYGYLAHGDDEDGSDVELVVVTHQPDTGPRPASRRIAGVIVDCGVISADEYLAHARTLTTSWPLTADRYVTTKSLYDPDGWHGRLRDTHLTRLAQAGAVEFTALAREAWCPAAATLATAIRLATWHDTDGAVLTLGEARLAAALVAGLLTRTYFRSSADAVRRTGFGDADPAQIAHRLAEQAEELDRRGQPVDGTPEDLLSRPVRR